MDAGSEAIADDAERAQVRKQARKVHVQALLVSALVTLLVLAIPSQL